MPEIKISCPHCAQRIQCSDGYGGLQIDCPNCRQKIFVPTERQTQFPKTGLDLHNESQKANQPHHQVITATAHPSSILTEQVRTEFLNQCPQCSSPDIQRAVMGFMAGTSQVSGLGVGTTFQGNIGIGSFGGMQQTVLSEYLRPPSKKATVKIVIITWVIVTMGFALYGCFKSGSSPAGLIAAPVIIPILYGTNVFDADEKAHFYIAVVAPTVIAIIIASFNFYWNCRKYPRLMAGYSRKWYCKKCGFSWLV